MRFIIITLLSSFICLSTEAGRVYKVDVHDRYAPVTVDENGKGAEGKEKLIFRDPDYNGEGSYYIDTDSKKPNARKKRPPKLIKAKDGLNELTHPESVLTIARTEITGRPKKPRVSFVEMPFSPEPRTEEKEISFLNQAFPETEEF